jgi:serine/threonine-protein kinase
VKHRGTLASTLACSNAPAEPAIEEVGLVVGAVIAGKYRLERLLGVGGVGVVFAACNLELDKRVAIKCLLPWALSQPRAVERFRREARAAAKMSGEHVAQVLDLGTLESGAPFIVLEYLEGCDLDSYLTKRGPLPIDEAVEYVLQACAGLSEAHAARIVHRDLKPANLFLAERPDGRKVVKLLDFGISKLLDGPRTSKNNNVMGTAIYMAPEQIHPGSEVDARTDIWALGVTMYELLTGEVPFVGDTVAETLARIILTDAAPIRSLRRDIPEALANVVARCLQSNPAERFRTVADLASALALVSRSPDREIKTSDVRIRVRPQRSSDADLPGATWTELDAVDETLANSPSMVPRRPTLFGVIVMIAFATTLLAALAFRSGGSSVPRQVPSATQPTAAPSPTMSATPEATPVEEPPAERPTTTAAPPRARMNKPIPVPPPSASARPNQVGRLPLDDSDPWAR